MSAAFWWICAGAAVLLTLAAVLVWLALHVEDDRPPPGHEYGEPTNPGSNNGE